MNKNQKIQPKKLFSIFTMLLVLFFTFYPPFKAQAGDLTALSDQMSRMQQSVVANHTFQFTLDATGDLIQSETITVTFPTGFTVTGVDCGDIDLEDDTVNEELNTEAGGCTAAATTWGASFTGQVLTLTAPSNAATYINLSSVIKIEIGTNALYNETGNEQITNQTEAQNTTNQKITFNADGDTGTIAVEIIADDTVDVTATVDPSISFSLSATSTAFGTLAPSVVDTATTDITLTVGTNAASGYKIYVNDAGNGTNPGLYRAAPSAAIIGSANATYGDTQDLDSAVGYGIFTDDTTTDADIAVDYDQTDASNIVGGLEITQKQYAEYTTAMTADHTVVIKHKAKAGSYTGAGTYNDTITWVATASF